MLVDLKSRGIIFKTFVEIFFVISLKTSGMISPDV